MLNFFNNYNGTLFEMRVWGRLTILTIKVFFKTVFIIHVNMMQDDLFEVLSLEFLTRASTSVSTLKVPTLTSSDFKTRLFFIYFPAFTLS